MNKYRQQWVKDLRSGKYRQGFGRLKSAHGFYYCVLGVACESVTKLSSRKYIFELNNLLPDKVATLLGLRTMSPRVIYKGHDRSLIGLNDTGHLSFKELADIIEQQPSDWDGVPF